MQPSLELAGYKPVGRQMLAEYEEDEDYMIIIEDIPRQLAKQGDLEKLTAAADATESLFAASFAITFIINLLLSGVMSQLWNIFNTLQIILALPFLTVLMPANVVFIQ